MSNYAKTASDRLIPIFDTIEKCLNEWTGDGCLQVPNLIGMLAVRLNWDEKQVRENDPIVRWYVRNHNDWYVTRGAHGGIMKLEDKKKKEELKAAKDALKAEMKAQIEQAAELKSKTNLVADSQASIKEIDEDQDSIDGLIDD